MGAPDPPAGDTQAWRLPDQRASLDDPLMRYGLVALWVFQAALTVAAFYVPMLLLAAIVLVPATLYSSYQYLADIRDERRHRERLARR